MKSNMQYIRYALSLIICLASLNLNAAEEKTESKFKDIASKISYTKALAIGTPILIGAGLWQLAHARKNIVSKFDKSIQKDFQIPKIEDNAQVALPSNENAQLNSTEFEDTSDAQTSQVQETDLIEPALDYIGENQQPALTIVLPTTEKKSTTSIGIQTNIEPELIKPTSIVQTPPQKANFGTQTEAAPVDIFSFAAFKFLVTHDSLTTELAQGIIENPMFRATFKEHLAKDNQFIIDHATKIKESDSVSNAELESTACALLILVNHTIQDKPLMKFQGALGGFANKFRSKIEHNLKNRNNNILTFKFTEVKADNKTIQAPTGR